MCPKTLTNTKKQLNKNATNTAILLRCSQPLSNKQTPHPTTKMERQPLQGVASGPNSVPAIVLPHTKTEALETRRLLLCTKPTPTTGEQTPHGSHPHNGDVFRGA